MAPSTHVWLLEQATPQGPEALPDWMRARLTDPLVLPLPFAWLRALVALLLIRLRLAHHADVLTALPGPSPETGAVADLARRLSRELGHRYAVQPVLRMGHPDAGSAAAGLQRGAQVVLLPLPLFGQDRRALLGEARAALGARGARLAEVHSLEQDPAVLDALARGVRQAILSLEPAGPGSSGPDAPDRDRPTVGVALSARPYEVLFCGVARGAESVDALEALRAALVRRLRLNRRDHLLHLQPFGLGRGPLAGAEPVLSALAGAPAVVVVPLGPLTTHADVEGVLGGALVDALWQRGVGRVVLARPPAGCSSLSYALAERVRAAERGMEWEVPEDRVQADVQAELERRGARQLPRAAAEPRP